MKILVPTQPRTNPGMPQLAGRVAGGQETSTETSVRCLVEAGHDVTVMTSANFPVEITGVKHVDAGYLSKAERRTCDWKGWTLSWMKLAEKYDRVFLNESAIFVDQFVAERLRDLAPRIRVVYHSDDPWVDTNFTAKNIQILSEINRHGGKVASVSRSLMAYLETRHPGGKLRPHLHYSKFLTEDISDFKVEQFNVGVVTNTQEVTDSNGDLVFIGRSDKEKNLKLAIEAYLASGVTRPFHIFTMEPVNAGSGSYYQQCRDISAGNIVWHVSRPRQEIFDCLASSSVLVFPSKDESFGLVALEAASFGLSIVHNNTKAGCFTSADYHCPKISKKMFAEGIGKCPIPALEEKRARADFTRKQFSREAYTKGLLDFLC